ncbi:uncharacterized protein LOC103518378 [Diaphorina citri]|uniref:inositol-polyphosphate 5-phosphatase n=1 Tax=Diaphorina citri TaxID=121845 RepID=A0A3Q0JG17_DIACI|nr:uncharacterized protein LOC103518378 [Diaphorina citri]
MGSTPMLLVTANVGSIFEDPSVMLKLWTEEFLSTVTRLDPKFVGVHCQEVGGKNYEQSMQHVEFFVKLLMSSEELRLFDKVRIFLDEDFSSAENFTALGNFYFIHKSITDILIWDFKELNFVSCEGQCVFSGNIEDVPTKEKSKFPQDFFPECKWSRKGFLRTRWNLQGTVFDLVNIHLFHDASNFVAMETFPSVYSKTRQRALDYTLESTSEDVGRKFSFLVVMILGKKEFSHSKHENIFLESPGVWVSIQGASKVRQRLNIFRLAFGTKLRLSMMSSEDSTEYNLIGLDTCMGDHKPVYLKFDLKNNEGIVRISNPPSTQHSTAPFIKSLSSSSSSSNSSKKLCRSCSVDIEDPLVNAGGPGGVPPIGGASGLSARTKTESPKSLKNIPVKQISFDDSMNLKGSKTSLSSVGLQFSIDPNLVDSNHTTSTTSSRKSSIKSIIIDKIKIVKRVNSESECSCQGLAGGKEKAAPGWRTRSVSLASSSPTSNANNPNHIFVRSISKLKLRNDSSFDANSQISLPRLESHHSSSDEDWFEQVEEKIIAIAGPDNSDTKEKRGKVSRRSDSLGEDGETFGSTSCFRLHKAASSEASPYRITSGNCNSTATGSGKAGGKSTNISKLSNIINVLKKQNRNSIIKEEDAEKIGTSTMLGEKSEHEPQANLEVEKNDVQEGGDEATGDELIDSQKMKKRKKKKKRRKRKCERGDGEGRKYCDQCCSIS